MFSKEEVEKRQAELAEEHRIAAGLSSILPAQAQVSKELMTGIPDWDILLQRLQAKIQEAEGLRDGEKMKLDNPNLSDPNEIQIIRQYIFIYNNSIDVLKSVMEIPLEIVSTH